MWRFKMRCSSNVSCRVLAGVGSVGWEGCCGGALVCGGAKGSGGWRGSPLNAIELAALLIAISTDEHQARSCWYDRSRRVWSGTENNS